MNTFSERTPARLIRCLLGQEIGCEHSTTLSLYPDGQSATPTCSHKMSGNSRHSLANLLALAALLTLFFALLHRLCSLLRD